MIKTLLCLVPDLSLIVRKVFLVSVLGPGMPVLP